MFWLSLMCGAGYAAYTAWQRKNEPMLDGPPEWPPLSESPASSPPSASEELGKPPTDGPDQRWLGPIDGACPDGYPIKANTNSGIFHVPGGRFYDRTVPERCYADAADAEADGYRRAKA
jgi:hypothetical protein